MLKKIPLKILIRGAMVSFMLMIVCVLLIWIFENHVNATYDGADYVFTLLTIILSVSLALMVLCTFGANLRRCNSCGTRPSFSRSCTAALEVKCRECRKDRDA